MAENGYEVAKAVVTLIPSMQGSQAIITKELTGASDVAGATAGKTMGKSMNTGLSSSMSSVGKTIAGVTAGIVGTAAALGAAIMESFKEVDAGLDIITTKTGASGTQLENMKTNMENLATSIPTTFEEAGSAIGEVNTRFKLTGQDLEDLSGKFIKFAKLNNTDVSTSVDNVSKVVAAFGMEAKDAESLLDALNTVGQSTGVDMDTLATTLSQNAAQLQEMGLSAYDAAGFLGSCDMAGLEISTTMMGLKTAMKNAAKDGQTLDDFLSEFTDTMNSNATESDKLTAAYETFGTRAGGAIYNAVKNGKLDLEDLTDNLGDFAGSVDSTFEAVTDPTDEFGEALNRMKVVGADIAESMMPILADALEGVAGIIEGIIDAFTPAETTLSRFIKETRDAIDANKAAMEATSGAVDDALSNVAEIDFYKGVIMDLNEKTTLTELEQYQLKEAVHQLSDSVPGLADAWDEANGTFKVSNEELENMFTNAQQLIVQQAFWDAQTESIQNLANAHINEARAKQAAEAAAKNFNETTEQTYTDVNALSKALGQDAWSNERGEVVAAAQAYGEAQEATKKAREESEQLPEALKQAALDWGLSAEFAEQMSQGLNNVGDSATEAAQEVAVASGQTEEEMKAAEEAAQKLEQEFFDLRDSIQQSTSDNISYLKTFGEETNVTIESMQQSLSESNASTEAWINNMTAVGEAIAGMAEEDRGALQALYDDMLQKGPQTAGEAAAAMASALQGEKAAFDNVVNEYSKSLDLTADSAKLAQYSSTGKAFTGEMKKGIESSASEVTNAAGQVASEATDEVNAEVDTGMDQVNNTWDAQMASMQSTADSAMSSIRSSVGSMITDISGALSRPIKGPMIQVPHFKMTGAFDAKTNKVPIVTVDWYEKGAIFTQPTIFETRYGFKGVGESGAEAVLPIDVLKNYIEDAVSAGTVINVAMEVNGAENPAVWAADFAHELKQQMRIS